MESASPVVLLVDDEEAVRRALKMLMASIGWQATEACDGKNALEKLRERPYNLVIIDINMPGMTGIELCRSIHLSYESPPVCIILSGLLTSKICDQARLAGAQAVLTKPIGRQDLIDEFKRLRLPCP